MALHMSGLLFIIMGQKNAELAGKVPDSQCPYCARSVVQGSNIRTGDGTPLWMLYQEVGATPSNMPTARCALGVGALKDLSFSTRDARKAYIQSFIDAPGRPRRWIRLPTFLWLESWFNACRNPKYKDSVCILRRAPWAPRKWSYLGSEDAQCHVGLQVSSPLGRVLLGSSTIQS